MLEYYLSKGFVVLEFNSNNLKIIANEEKQIIHAIECMIQAMLWLVLPQLIRKHKSFLPVRGNLVVVCNLIYVRYSVTFNGVKLLVVNVTWTLFFVVLHVSGCSS